MKQKCIIGVDAGGTKTEVRAFTLSGDTIISINGGCGSLGFNQEKNIENITLTINKVIKEIEVNYQIIYLQLGIAGLGAYYKVDELKNKLINQFKVKVSLVNDAELALYSIVKDEHERGILVLAGTGSACFGIYNNKIALVSGWGQLLGDEGSSYELAIRALKLITQDEDDTRPHREISKKLMKHLNIDNPFDLKKFVYNSTKTEIASLSKKISGYANEGDKDSIEMLKKSGLDLANFAYQVYKKLGMNGEVAIGVRGSFILKGAYVFDTFQDELNKLIPSYLITSSETPPIYGAYYLAKRKLGIN